MNFQHSQTSASATQAAAQPREAPKAETFVREERKVERNEPCPCGSGKNTSSATANSDRDEMPYDRQQEVRRWR